jgi:uncharacterized membrane-anchored protein YitT (DUF2179 family)
MMAKIEQLWQSISDYLMDHPKLKALLEYAFAFFIAVLSAFLQAYTFRAFIIPPVTNNEVFAPLITGGISGTSQILVKIIEIFNLLPMFEGKTIQAFLYISFNIPLFWLAFKGIGKRFAIFSLINVAFTSFFIEILPIGILTLFDISSDMLSRALFAGIIGGIASAIAFQAEISSGGLDVITYYIANVKSTSVGKYAVTFNAIILVIFTSLIFLTDESQTLGQGALNSFLYSIIFFFTASRIVDAFNSRNKKTQIQIISSQENLPKIIMANFPHGCTVVPAIGGFSGDPRNIIYMVVSSFEVKQVVKLVRKSDPNSFINVSNSTQVYGRFFIKPVK